jgi:hypothetical protein
VICLGINCTVAQLLSFGTILPESIFSIYILCFGYYIYLESENKILGTLRWEKNTSFHDFCITINEQIPEICEYFVLISYFFTVLCCYILHILPLGDTHRDNCNDLLFYKHLTKIKPNISKINQRTNMAVTSQELAYFLVQSLASSSYFDLSVL